MKSADGCKNAGRPERDESKEKVSTASVVGLNRGNALTRTQKFFEGREGYETAGQEGQNGQDRIAETVALSALSFLSVRSAAD